jgi:hypothetical protein
MKNAFRVLVVTATLAFAALPASAAELKIGASDTVQTTLVGQKGARVTVRTRSGQEITGVVREVNANVVQIGAVTGKEFFDAVIPLTAVDAVYVRVKD